MTNQLNKPNDEKTTTTSQKEAEQYEKDRINTLRYGWYSEIAGLDALIEAQSANKIPEVTDFPIVAIENGFLAPTDSIGKEPPENLVGPHHGYYVLQTLKMLLPKASIQGLSHKLSLHAKKEGAAIQHAIEMGKRVINISTTAIEASQTEDDRIALEAALHQATELRVPIISVPGNQTSDSKLTYAAFEQPIIVGGIYTPRYGIFASLPKAAGSRVDIYAPGDDIEVLTQFGPFRVDGHSFAAPFVTAACAIVQAKLDLAIPDLKSFLIEEGSKELSLVNSSGEHEVVRVLNFERLLGSLW